MYCFVDCGYVCVCIVLVVGYVQVWYGWYLVIGMYCGVYFGYVDQLMVFVGCSVGIVCVCLQYIGIGVQFKLFGQVVLCGEFQFGVDLLF